jgi:predicted metal-binding membrane protein
MAGAPFPDPDLRTVLRARLAWSRGGTAAALLVVGALSWWLLARSAAVMSAMSGSGVLLDAAIAMMRPANTVPYLIVTVLMWIVMMSAMMTPAIVPVVMLFERLDRRRAGSGAGGSSTARGDGVVFAAGYLLVWLGFAVVATALQWALHRAALLHTHALAAGPVLAGVLLVLAGLYQLTPYKGACLAHCQTPLAFLLGSWEDGRRGALRMGARHGLYCLGCCWALMLLMFAGGVMSLTAMAVLTVFILAERLLPAGPWAAKLPGIGLVLWGAVTLAYAAG